MKKNLNYCLIALICISLIGCFGNKKSQPSKRSRYASDAIESSSQSNTVVDWTAAFTEYKVGKSTTGTVIAKQYLAPTFSKEDYIELGSCVEAAFNQSSGTNMERILTILDDETEGDDSKKEGLVSCCKKSGDEPSEPLPGSLASRPEFTFDDAMEIQLISMHPSSLMLQRVQSPTVSLPYTYTLSGGQPTEYVYTHPFAANLWIEKTEKYYNPSAFIEKINREAKGGGSIPPLKPFTLGASRTMKAYEISGKPGFSMLAHETGGIVGPDKATLIAFFNAAPARSLKDLVDWYYKTFEGTPDTWLADFFIEVFWEVFPDAISCKSSDLRKQWINASPDPNFLKTQLANGERDFICNTPQEAITNLVNQFLMTGSCVVPASTAGKPI